MWISSACAVHCAALPLLLTVAGLGFLGESWLEWTIIGLSFVIASFRLVSSYRQHGQAQALALFATGAVSILVAKFVPSEAAWFEPVFMTAGGLLIASAHWQNHRIFKHCCNTAH